MMNVVPCHVHRSSLLSWFIFHLFHVTFDVEVFDIIVDERDFVDVDEGNSERELCRSYSICM